MKRTLGFFLLAFVLALLIGSTCYVFGWKLGLGLWGIGFALALIVGIAMFLIEEGE